MELQSLAETRPRVNAGSFSTPSFRSWKHVARKTTYFDRVTATDGIVVPTQALLEKSASRTAIRRQSTRYSAHGLHDYKGKFNPQVVRAVGNIIGLKPGSRVLDPFCGSGTVLVEAIHNGWAADGIDLNPLAIEIAQAKTHALLDPGSLLQALDVLVLRLDHLRSVGRNGTAISRDETRRLARHADGTGRTNNDYAASWFCSSVLAQIDAILSEVGRLGDQNIERVFQVVLSNLLRSVSHQDEADLRVRRRKEPLQNAPLIDVFLTSASVRLQEVASARAVLGQRSQSVVQATLGDSSDVLAQRSEAVYDAVITSPPYAMALPYIDTQRLSLAVLGLVPPGDLARLERNLIGSRDIPVHERRSREAEIQSGEVHLPRRSLNLCRRLLNALGDGDGFRRTNMPALLSRYLVGMSRFLEKCRPCIKAGGHLAMVVGKNETNIGGRQWKIDTPGFLAEIAEYAGYTVVDVLPLDAYQRYGLHAANSIREESLVLLRA